MKKNIGSRTPLFLVIIAYLILQLLTFRTGIGLEELRDILLSKQCSEGFLPYRDFYWFYGPLGIYFWALLIKLFGSELILMRLAVIFIGAIGITIVYNLSKKIMSNNFSLLAAFCSFALFTFPCYSFNHYLSVMSVVITLWYVVKFFFDIKWDNLFMWGVFLTITFLIRPAPTGISLVFVSLLIIVLFSIRLGFFMLLKNIFYLFSFFTVAVSITYFLTGGLFFKNIFMHFILSTQDKIIFRFPNTIKLVKDFFYSLHMYNLKDISTIYNIITFINLISSHIIYWFIFVFPGVFISIILYTTVIKKRLRDVPPIDYLSIFLYLLSFLLSLYFYYSVSVVSYPDLDGAGQLWLWVGQYLLQPGIIFFSYSLYSVKKRTSRIFLTTATSCILILSVTLPKIINLRYMFIKMPVGRISGIKGIYLTNSYEKFYVPSSEYINKEKDIPEYIFLTSYFPTFYGLTNKKPLFPEDLVAFFLDLSNLKKVRKIIYFCKGSDGCKSIDEDDVDKIILDRLTKMKPCIVSFDDDLDLLKNHFKWKNFIMDNYHIAKKFTYKRSIPSKDSYNNPVITIYLPNSR